jgi:hypothetical protein
MRRVPKVSLNRFGLFSPLGNSRLYLQTIRTSSLTGTIMGGLMERLLFRLYAYFYFMLHWEVRLMLAEEDWHLTFPVCG